MKKLISIIIITLGFLPLMAQNDYYIKQAQSYQREAMSKKSITITDKHKVISERLNTTRSGRTTIV